MTTKPLSPVINPSRASIKAPQKQIHFSSKISGSPDACVPGHWCHWCHRLAGSGHTDAGPVLPPAPALATPSSSTLSSLSPRHQPKPHTQTTPTPAPTTQQPGAVRKSITENWRKSKLYNCWQQFLAAQQRCAYSFILLMAYFDLERREESLVVCKSAG